MPWRPIVALLLCLGAAAPSGRAQTGDVEAFSRAFDVTGTDVYLIVDGEIAATLAHFSPAQSSPTAGTAALEGMVVNAQTGEPVRKAEVTAMWSGGRNTDNSGHDPQTTSTDSNGHFTINGLAAGKYRIRVEANRFAGQSYGQSRAGGRGKEVEVAAGQRVSGLEIRLLPCGVVTGDVKDESGDAVEGAIVQAIPVGRMRGFQSGSQAQTNDLGQYRLYNLAPGPYLIQVALSRQDEQRGAQEAYVPLFYPDATDPSLASTITVDAGSETQSIDFDVHPVHAVRVRGRVVNESGGRSTQNAYVMLMPAALDPHRRLGAVAMMTASRYASNVNDPRGDFEVTGVPAGSYWAVATLQDGQGQYQGRVPLQVGDADVQGVTIPVSAGANLAGHVRLDQQRAFDFSKLAISAIPVEPVAMGGQGTEVRPDGGFSLENVAAGSYRVMVAGYPENYYVKSVRFGGTDVLESGLSVDSGSGSAQLDVVLSAGGSTVSGTVLKDQKPAPGTVYLVPDAPRRDRLDLYSVQRTRPDGSFTMLGVPPGDFKLFAFEDPDPSLLSDPTLFQPFEAKATSLHLDEGQKQTVQLELIPSQE